MTANEFIQNLKRQVYCRLSPSLHHGVGVFAIRQIPKGVNPMTETRQTDFITIPTVAITADPDIAPEVKKLVLDMCPENLGSYDVPNYSLNEIGISFFLNHSSTPNMTEDDGDFYALRDIEPGEELTVDYGTYSALNLG